MGEKSWKKIGGIRTKTHVPRLLMLMPKEISNECCGNLLSL